MNKKHLLIALALLGITTLTHANSYSAFSNVNFNNSYSCSLTGFTPNTQVTACTFTFTSVSTYSKGLLYCNLLGSGSDCTIGTKSGSTTTWTCTLNQQGLDYLNNCLSSGKCNFGFDCQGNCRIGGCQIDYQCKPPQNVPDSATTIYILGIALLGLEMSRRKLATAK